MRDFKKPVLSNDNYLQIIQEITGGKKIKEIIFFHIGINLGLSKSDCDTIETLLNLAIDMHPLIGELSWRPCERDIIDYCIPIPESCYKEIKNIVVNRQREPDDKESGLMILPIYFMVNKRMVSMNVAYLFETDDEHYYVLGGV